MTSLLLLTNNRVSLNDPLVMLAAGDSYSYFEIAQSFPDLPSKQITFHHAQRFMIPYIIGFIYNITGIPIESLFYYVVIILVCATIFVVHQTLKSLNLCAMNELLSLSLIIFNPYFFRFYITFPGMINDLFFNLGLSITLLSLTNKRSCSLFVGILLCSVSRQTALMIIIPTAVWICIDWKQKNLTKLSIISFFTLFIISYYFISGKVASIFSSESRNFEHITGIVPWLFNGFNIKELLMFIFRWLIPFIMPLALYFGIIFSTKDGVKDFEQNKIVLLVTFFLFLIAQPIMAGPAITGGNIQRLCLPALLPFIMAFSVITNNVMKKLETNHNFQLFIIIELLIFSGSMHHLYSFYQPAPDQTLYFCFFYILSSCFVFFTMIYMTRHISATSLS